MIDLDNLEEPDKGNRGLNKHLEQLQVWLITDPAVPQVVAVLQGLEVLLLDWVLRLKERNPHNLWDKHNLNLHSNNNNNSKRSHKEDDKC